MLWTALFLGFAGSLHCVGMCGPISLVLPFKNAKGWQLFFKMFLYHLGRLSAYFTIGLLFGSLGKGLYLSGFQQRLSILMGALMIIAVLIPSSFFRKYNITKPMFFLIAKVKSKLSYYINKKSKIALFSIGFFNGFLPCGLVYMALIGAVSMASVLQGGFYMMIFGLGTIPLLSVFVIAKNFVTLSFRNRVQKMIPFFVVIVGLLFIMRGLSLGIPYLSPSDANLQISNNPANCVTIEKTK